MLIGLHLVGAALTVNDRIVRQPYYFFKSQIWVPHNSNAVLFESAVLFFQRANLCVLGEKNGLSATTELATDKSQIRLQISRTIELQSITTSSSSP